MSVDTRERRPERRQWVKLTAYAASYDVDPRTVLKWAEAGLVQLERITMQGSKRTLVRVKNAPPWKVTPASVDPRA